MKRGSLQGLKGTAPGVSLTKCTACMLLHWKEVQYCMYIMHDDEPNSMDPWATKFRTLFPSRMFSGGGRRHMCTLHLLL